MKYFIRKLFQFIAIVGLVSGCTSLRGADYRDVYGPVEKRTGFQLEKVSPEKDYSEAVSDLIGPDLTLDNALRIALINNADLQAVFQSLGIAKADLVQASLFKNPRFEGHARVPSGEGKVNTEFVVMQDVMSILLSPLRRRVASSEFVEAKLRVSDAMISLMAEVKTAYYEAKAREGMKRTHQVVLEAAEASTEFAERLYKAGNINTAELGVERAAYQEAKIHFIESESEARIAREPLNRLLGLSNELTRKWSVRSEFPELPAADPTFEDVTAIALENRLDYAAIRKHSETLKRKLFATRLGVIPEASIGFNTERESDGSRVTGPAWDVEVPVFDRQQTGLARTRSEILKNQYEISSFEVQIYSEVREAYEKMASARLKAERYKNDLIPIRHQLVSDLQKHYNYMLVGVFQLLEAKRKALEAEKEYIESIKDYWVARSMLERSVGGKLPDLSGIIPVSQSNQSVMSKDTAKTNHGGHAA